MTSSLLPVFKRSHLAFTDGEGVWLKDQDGKRYLDFASGLGVNILGYGHPALRDLLRKAAEGGLLHVSNLYQIPEQEALAKRLAKASFAEFAFFCNSGAEAVECALKIARAYQAKEGAPEKMECLSFEGAFHGRTLGALSASGKMDIFGDPLAGFRTLPFGDTKALEKGFSKNTGAVLIEPIKGEGGVHIAPPSFMKALRALCDSHGALLIFDEVQCGMGRTGHLFAYEDLGVTPDIVALAKGLGGGIPIGCALATKRAAGGMKEGMHGSTFGGNPLAMKAGLAVLDCLMEADFLPHVRKMEGRLRQQLSMLANLFPGIIKEIRGKGLMFGLDMTPPMGDVLAALEKEGLLATAAAGNVLRLLPPLILDEKDLEEAIHRMEKALKRLG